MFTGTREGGLFVGAREGGLFIGAPLAVCHACHACHRVEEEEEEEEEEGSWRCGTGFSRWCSLSSLF